MALIYAPTYESKRLLKATMAFGQRRRREHQCAQLLARRPSNSLYCHVLHDALLLFCCVACVGMLLPVRTTPPRPVRPYRRAVPTWISVRRWASGQRGSNESGKESA